ncbi:MAG: enoyl-CoA hydratase/isomerase family protein [Deltaproteobacteria bacterium]|nr:enoyl-CoA hydratase/isomerase family protein [Deltaproteobacteria bacterium]MBW1863028.1 enoyl-CoA hydratase/isomerase family protein [Deltaproteobacteria bacterium]
MVDEGAVSFEKIIYEKKDHALWIILNRPDKKNAQDPQTREELARALKLGRDDDDIYLMVITGAGDDFCAGGDIVNFPKNPVEFMERVGLQVTGKKRPIELIREIPKPVIAMVKGLALGAGMELAMACDMIFASENARFGQPEIKVGLIPGGGGTQVLPRLVGEKKAKELVMTGSLISAREACEIGLINRAIPEDELMETVEKLVADLLKKSPIILKFAKMAVNKTFETPLSAGLAYESDLCALCFGTEDLKEGARAFSEKRSPVFKGK